MRVAFWIYLLGVALALWRTDASWAGRIVLALLWPIGPIAFAITVSLLLAASLIAFPVLGVAVAGAVLLVWWLA